VRRYVAILRLTKVLANVVFFAALLGGIAALVSRGFIIGVIVFFVAWFVLRVALLLVHLLLVFVFVGPAAVRLLKLDKPDPDA
jgi:mannose/fructose/N-acetylgalactosamine-specific phosphotransferase system component IID